MECVWVAGDIKLLQNCFGYRDTRQHMHSLSVMEVRFTVYAFISVACTVSLCHKKEHDFGKTLYVAMKCNEQEFVAGNSSALCVQIYPILLYTNLKLDKVIKRQSFNVRSYIQRNKHASYSQVMWTWDFHNVDEVIWLHYCQYHH